MGQSLLEVLNSNSQLSGTNLVINASAFNEFLPLRSATLDHFQMTLHTTSYALVWYRNLEDWRRHDRESYWDYDAAQHVYVYYNGAYPLPMQEAGTYILTLQTGNVVNGEWVPIMVQRKIEITSTGVEIGYFTATGEPDPNRTDNTSRNIDHFADANNLNAHSDHQHSNNSQSDHHTSGNSMSNLRYRVQLSPTADFAQPITIDNISGTSIAIEQFAPLYETAYGATFAGDTVYWRVQEYDTTGEYLDSDWSEVWSMTIAEAEQPPTYGERGVLLNHIGRTMPFSPMHSNRHDASLFHDAATYRFRYQNQRTSEIFYITATKADFPIHAGNVGSQTTSAVERVWQKERGLWNDTDLLAGDQLSLLGVYWNADSNPNAPYVPAPLFHGVTPASALLTVMPQNAAKAVVQSEFKYNDIRGEAYSQNTDGTQNGMIGAWSNLELHNNAIGAVYSERVMISATGGTTYSIPQGFGYVITPEVSADNHAFAGYTIQRWTPGVGYGTVGNGTPVLHTFVAERQAVQPKKLPTPILVSPDHNSVNVALTANLVWRRGEVSWADGSGGGGGGSKEE